MYSEMYSKMKAKSRGGKRGRGRPVSLRPQTPASRSSGGGHNYGSYHDTPHTMGFETGRSTGYVPGEYAAASPEMGFQTKGPEQMGSSY